MIDIHCHILPYVDDGAQNLDEALYLLDAEAQQGVTAICLTPHLRNEMFDTPDDKIRSRFEQLNSAREQEDIPVRLYLSREYYYDSRFRELLEAGNVIPMADGKTLLVEFSYRSSFDTLAEAAALIQAAGYQPLFAHCERYRAIQEDPARAAQLCDLGVRIQLNADGILGLDGWTLKRTCKYILKKHLAYAVASDTHDPEVRKPNLEKCRKYLEKKYGREYASQLMHDHPLNILSTK